MNNFKMDSVLSVVYAYSEIAIEVLMLGWNIRRGLLAFMVITSYENRRFPKTSVFGQPVQYPVYLLT